MQTCRLAEADIMTCKISAAAGALAAGLLVLHAWAADGPMPGLWKITTRPEADGVAAPAQEKTRCLRPEDVRDLEKTFVPEFGAQGSSCRRIDLTWTGQKLAWHIQCTGPLTMDVAGAYEFDTPQHYTGFITTQASMGGREMRSRTTLEGERLGECDDRCQMSDVRCQKVRIGRPRPTHLSSDI